MIRRLIICLALVLLSATVCAQNRHTVTIAVPPIMNSLVTPTALTMTITGSGTPAGGSSFQVVNEDTYVYWATNYINGKITVQTSLNTTIYKLYLAVIEYTSGTPVITSNTLVPFGAQNLITGIGKSMGSCRIRYTGVADATDTGGQEDRHQITYTLTNL